MHNGKKTVMRTCLKKKNRKSQHARKRIELINNYNIHESTERFIDNSRQQLEYLLNFLPDPTFAVDIEGRVIAWNHAMEKLSGIPAKNILGQGDFAYSVPYYGFKRPILLDLIIRPDKNTERKYPTLTRDNETLITEVFAPAMKPSTFSVWPRT